MRLPWHKAARVEPGRLAEAKAEAQAAQTRLDQTKERGVEVRRVAASLRDLRQANHFSESLAAMLAREGRGHAPNSR